MQACFVDRIVFVDEHIQETTLCSTVLNYFYL